MEVPGIQGKSVLQYSFDPKLQEQMASSASIKS